MEAGDCEFAKFTLPIFKGNSEGPWLECVKQQAITCCSCYRMPKTACFSTNLRFYGQPKNNAKTLFFHPPSLFPGNFCNCNSGGIIYTVWTNTSEIGPEVTAATFHNFLHKRLQRAFTCANQLHWTAQEEIKSESLHVCMESQWMFPSSLKIVVILKVIFGWRVKKLILLSTLYRVWNSYTDDSYTYD